MKKFKRIAIITLILLTILVVFANLWIEKSTATYVYRDLNKIPHNKAGLLLGTSRFLHGGVPNEYFQNRIKAAFELFNTHKIEAIVISGDNSRKTYNEPLDMKNELVKLGIPETKIYLDYAGFRTYDSVIRMNKIFGQSSFTVISQEFHNRRAVFIARQLDLNAIGYNAEDVDIYNGFKTRVREKFARVKVLLDLMIHKEPHFLGNKIEIY